MSCVWQGNVDSVTWPRRDSAIVKLLLELWLDSEKEDLAIASLYGCTMEFQKFVFTADVPLWAVRGPELIVMTQDALTLDFFKEFSTLKGIALNLQIASTEPSSATSKTRYSNVLIYTVSEGSSVEVAARPLDTTFTPPVINELARPLRNPGSSQSSKLEKKVSAELSKTSDQPSLPPPPLVDVKKAIQQTIMGALRLRGIRTSNTDFKRIYFSVLNLVELSLRKQESNKITLHMIHDKVEAILSIVD